MTKSVLGRAGGWLAGSESPVGLSSLMETDCPALHLEGAETAGSTTPPQLPIGTPRTELSRRSSPTRGLASVGSGASRRRRSSCGVAVVMGPTGVPACDRDATPRASAAGCAADSATRPHGHGGGSRCALAGRPPASGRTESESPFAIAPPSWRAPIARRASRALP